MDVQQKLSGFYKVVTGEAQKKKEEIFYEIKENIDSSFKQEFQKSCRNATEKINAKRFELEQNRNKELVKVISQSRKKLLFLRDQLKNELFDQLKTKIDDFVRSKDYLKIIEQDLKKIKYDDFRIEISSKDTELFKQVNKKMKTKVFLSQEDFWGGYRIYLEDRKAVVDKSLKNRFERLKEEFNKFKLPNL